MRKPGFLQVALASLLLAIVLLQPACGWRDRPPASRGAGLAGEEVAPEIATPPAVEAEPPGTWVALSALPWLNATTGWVATSEDDLPALDRSFRGGPLVIGGVGYQEGIGVYPLSEISYALDGQYAIFESDVGLNDLPAGVGEDNPGGVVFTVYLDGALVFDSGVMRRGQAALPVRLAVAGVQELRLVAYAAGSPSTTNFADWAGARLLRPAEPPDREQIAKNLAPLRQQVAERMLRRDDARKALAATAAVQRAALDKAGMPTGGPGATVAVAHPGRTGVTLANGVLAVSYGLSGDEHGLLTVLHLPSNRLVLYRADSSVLIAPDVHLSLHNDTLPSEQDSYRTTAVQDPVFGHGQRAEIELMAKERPVRLILSLTLFDASPYFIQQIEVASTPATPLNPRFSHFDPLGPSNFALGEGLQYLTDVSRLRSAAVLDDGIQRRESVDQGKPVFLSSTATGMGLLIAAVDETVGPTELLAQVDAGRVMGRLGFSSGAMRVSGQPGSPVLQGPRLYVEVTTTTQPRQAFENFRRFAGQLYPPLPLPDWVRYQWLSWYVYNIDINEGRLRRQIDYIADNLSDLGPWHIVVDAGWYVAEGRSGAEWRNVDRAKFPGGLRALVDYAHRRGVKVVLYFSAPYLDSRERTGDWLGLRKLIEEHRDWLIPIGEDETRQSFVYDFDNPALREYMASVMEDFFVRYDVDGIKIDGLGNADGAALSPAERDAFGLVDKVRQPALDIYRFVREQAEALKKDTYIESGWSTPLFAGSLAHTFRYGDESPSFSNRYPAPGLVEHVDYAIAQQTLWGQRANMGAAYGDPNNGTINERWLEAALGLGAQVSLSFDLTSLTPETLSRYRALLSHYRPFAGTTYYGNTLGIDSFATTRDGTTYLVVLNRSGERRSVELPLTDYGLLADQQYRSYAVASGRFGLTQGKLQLALEPQSLRLILLRGEPGVIWTNSSFEVERADGMGLALAARGPAHLPGFMQLYVPSLREVLLDNIALRSSALPGESGYNYDSDTAILTLRYGHEQPHRLEIVY